MESNGAPNEPSFDFPSYLRLYNKLAEKQNALVSDYIAAFNLLDPDERGYISVIDLRHALCNVGDALSDQEFNHLLYTHNLLSHNNVTIYELLRLLLDLPTDVVVAQCSQGASSAS